MFESELTDRYNVEYPIMNAGMGQVALGDLAGAVASEGGIGVVGATGMDADDLRRELDTFYEWAPDGSLVVDLLFPIRGAESKEDVPKPNYIPAPVNTIEEELEQQGIDVPDVGELDPENALVPIMENARQLMDVAEEYNADALATAVGAPEWVIEQAHDSGMDVIALAGLPRHAIYAYEAGADLVVADGTEGGGHSGPIGTLDLIPMVQDVVDLPVIAAGGISRGSQILSTISCGAVGVWIGTRFIPTRESDALHEHKRRIVQSKGNATIRSELADGMYMRNLRNRFTEVWEEHLDEIMDFPEQAVVNAPAQVAIGEALRNGEISEEVAADYQFMPAGQGIALVDETEKFPSATLVVRELVEQTEEAYDTLTEKWSAEVEV